LDWQGNEPARLAKVLAPCQKMAAQVNSSQADLTVLKGSMGIGQAAQAKGSR
jgi:catalase-peroxidase